MRRRRRERRQRRREEQGEEQRLRESLVVPFLFLLGGDGPGPAVRPRRPVLRRGRGGPFSLLELEQRQ